MNRDVQDLASIQAEAAQIMDAERAAYAPENPPDRANDPDRERLESMKIWAAIGDNEKGDALLFRELHRGRFIFDHAASQWHVWDGHFWRLDTVGEVLDGLDAVVDLYSKEHARVAAAAVEAARAGKDTTASEEDEKALRKRISALQSRKRAENVVHLAAQGRDGLGIAGDEWDLDPWLLGCPNGVLELKTGDIRAGYEESDFIKTPCPTEWQGLDAPAPTWERFLHEIFDGDRALVDYLYRLLGYSITGVTTEHVLPVLHGKGRNGKSVLLETIAHVLGPLAAPVAPELMLQQPFAQSSQGPRADLVALRGRRIVWASETDEGRRLNAGRVKQLTGGDSITARAPYGKREVSFRPTHILLLLTNFRPRTDADDYALWQRLRLIPFNLAFVDNPTGPNERQRDPALPEKLKAEAPGILAWLVRGCLAWQERGLEAPESVVLATCAYQDGEDILGRFLDECCHMGPGAWCKARDIYAAYKGWCADSGCGAWSEKRFSERLSMRFDRKRRKYGMIYEGVGLLGA